MKLTVEKLRVLRELGVSDPELRDLGSDLDKLLGLAPPSQQDLEISRLTEQNRLLKHALLDLYDDLASVAGKVIQNFEELNK